MSSALPHLFLVPKPSAAYDTFEGWWAGEIWAQRRSCSRFSVVAAAFPNLARYEGKGLGTPAAA